MSTGELQYIHLGYLPRSAEHWIKVVKRHFGENLRCKDGVWSLNLTGAEKQLRYSNMVCPIESIPLRGNIDKVVERMSSTLNQRYEDKIEQTMNDFPEDQTAFDVLLTKYNIGLALAKRRYGIIPNLHNGIAHLCFTRHSRVNMILKEQVLPIMTELFHMTHVVPTEFEVDFLYAANIFAKLHYISTVLCLCETRNIFDKEGALDPFEMYSGRCFMNLLESLTRFGEISSAYPFNRGVHTWHFYKEGGSLEPYESAVGVSNIFLIPDETRKNEVQVNHTESHNMFESALRREGMVKQNITAGVFGINSLLEYFCNLRNFMTPSGDLDSSRYLQSVYTLRLMLADFQSITISPESNAKVILALAFLDKMANLVNGMCGKKNIADGTIFKNWVRRDRVEFLQKLLEKKLTKRYPKFGWTLKKTMQQCFKDLRKGLLRANCSSAENDSAVSRLYDLRRVNHGAFLRGDTFKTLFKEGGDEFPPEIIMLPYFLMWGFMLSPREFAEYVVANLQE